MSKRQGHGAKFGHEVGRGRVQDLLLTERLKTTGLQAAVRLFRPYGTFDSYTLIVVILSPAVAGKLGHRSTKPDNGCVKSTSSGTQNKHRRLTKVVSHFDEPTNSAGMCNRLQNPAAAGASSYEMTPTRGEAFQLVTTPETAARADTCLAQSARWRMQCSVHNCGTQSTRWHPRAVLGITCTVLLI